jgi:O-antigen/teichoic acid export membrane protein
VIDAVTRDWLNRAGLTLGFFAFWFAAPEVLGEARLRALEHALEGMLRISIKVVAGVGLLVFFGSLPLAIWIQSLWTGGSFGQLLDSFSTTSFLLFVVVDRRALAKIQRYGIRKSDPTICCK